MRNRVLLVWLTAAVVLLCAGEILSANYSVTLTWTAPGDNGAVGWATQYDLRYSIAPITDANWALATKVLNLPAPRPAGNREILKVSGLLPATTYYFALKAADSKPNWSPMSNNAIKMTCPGICTGVNGNINNSVDLRVDLSDLTLLVIYLTSPNLLSVYTMCTEMANTDGSPNGMIDLSDLSQLIGYLTGSKTLAPCR